MLAHPIFALMALASSLDAPIPSQLPPPTGKWVLNYADKYCTLSRLLTDPEPGVAFRTRPFADDHELLLTLPPTGIRRFSGMGTLYAGDLTAGHERPVDVTFAQRANLKAVETTITATELSAAMATGKLRLVVPGKFETSLKLTAANKAGMALRACEDDLARRWKIERNWVIDPLPLADPRSVFKADDYPLDMVHAGKSGAVRALLAIDPAGKVTSCRIIDSSGHEVLDKATCTVLGKRVAFTPARNSSGQPIASYYLGPTVRFQLEF